MSYRFSWPLSLVRSPAAPDPVPDPEIPPRPRLQQPGTVTTPRLFAPGSPVDPDFDPCGAWPIKPQREGTAS